MKLKFILLIISVLSIISCKNQESKETHTATEKTVAKAPAKKPETVTFTIDGMTCAVGCAKTIEKKLNALDGVQEAKVDFDKKQAVVHFDLDKLSTDDLKKTVEAVADGKTYKVSNLVTAGK